MSVAVRSVTTTAAVVIPVEGPPEVRAFVSSDPIWKQVRDFLDGGFMDIIHAAGLKPISQELGVSLVMLWDDEGRLRKLSPNPIASRLYEAATVVGPVLIVAEVIDGQGLDLAWLSYEQAESVRSKLESMR